MNKWHTCSPVLFDAQKHGEQTGASPESLYAWIRIGETGRIFLVHKSSFLERTCNLGTWQVQESSGPEAAGMRIKLIDTVGLEDAESGDAVNLQVGGHAAVIVPGASSYQAYRPASPADPLTGVCVCVGGRVVHANVHMLKLHLLHASVKICIPAPARKADGSAQCSDSVWTGCAPACLLSLAVLPANTEE
eukprot:1139412-Pelagomonas_calceolata.AAC.2